MSETSNPLDSCASSTWDGSKEALVSWWKLYKPFVAPATSSERVGIPASSRPLSEEPSYSKHLHLGPPGLNAAIVNWLFFMIAAITFLLFNLIFLMLMIIFKSTYLFFYFPINLYLPNLISWFCPVFHFRFYNHLTFFNIAHCTMEPSSQDHASEGLGT